MPALAGAVYLACAPLALAPLSWVYYPSKLPGPCCVFCLVPEQHSAQTWALHHWDRRLPVPLLRPVLLPLPKSYQSALCSGARPDNSSAYAGPLHSCRCRSPMRWQQWQCGDSMHFCARTSPCHFRGLRPCYNPGGHLGGGSIGAYHACHMSGAYGRKSIDASAVYMNKVSARPEGMTGQRAELRAIYRRPWAKDAQPPSPLSTHLVHSLNGKKGEAASAPVTGTKDPYSGEAPKDMPFRRHS